MKRPAGNSLDLRAWLDVAKKLGELKEVPGADAKLELGAISELNVKIDGAPALLFDEIKGYPKGFRVLTCSTASPARLSSLLRLPVEHNHHGLVQKLRGKPRGWQAEAPKYDPVVVETGAVLENIQSGKDVDITIFPSPLWHEKDGGPYIGTGCCVVTRDFDSDWVNVGTYRVQVFDRNTVGLWISPGKHGRLIREKYFARGLPCPVAISVGTDPLLFITAGNEIDFGVNEYAYAGGHRGRPFDVVESELHGLPIPANDEIVLEGEIMPDDVRTEGPFGEFTGYYASGEQSQPAVRIRRIYHRNDPIITTARPGRPPHDFSFSKSVSKAATIWEEMEKAGLPGVTGVWSHEAGGSRMFNVVAIKQMYPGHARQAGHLAFACHAGNYLGRWVVVVDDDIDPTNTFEVIWALSTRCDPATSIDIIGKAWSGPLDPVLPKGVVENSRAVIDACRPWSRKDSFPPVAEASKEVMAETYKKWRFLLDQ